MAISANSIVHYTNKLATLKSILNDEGFMIQYCSEKVVTRGNKSYSLAIAMVSFCDIPLSDYKKHFKNKNENNLGYYGDYGIGLSKEWATKNGLNPIIYIEHNSHVGSALRKTIELHTKNNNYDNVNLNTFQNDEFAQFVCYSKNYQGDLWRSEKLMKKSYRFYDEREWRYVPTIQNIGNNKVILNNEDYLTNKHQLNANLESFKLKFTLDDISYLIIKEDSEISEFIIFLKKLLTNRNYDYQKLLTKIITSEQILNDF